MYLRFIRPDALHPDSGYPEGLFRLGYRMKRDPDIAPEDRARLTELLGWFGDNLKEPDRFNRSKSKGAYRRNTKGLSWFRDTAHEHISRMRQIARILREYGHPVEEIREVRVGYVVYEDGHQVVAEPFADTEVGR